MVYESFCSAKRSEAMQDIQYSQVRSCWNLECSNIPAGNVLLAQSDQPRCSTCLLGRACMNLPWLHLCKFPAQREPVNAPGQGIRSLLKCTTLKTSPYLILTTGHGRGKELPAKQKCPLGQSWGTARPVSLQNVPSGQSLQRDWPRP